MPGDPGEPLALTGRVMTTACRPLAGYIVDAWHADASGGYHGFGGAGNKPEPAFNYRGRVTTDGDGRYRMATIVPAVYAGRPRHIHIKVYAAGTVDFVRAFTTQLYWPNDPNRGSGFNDQLTLRLAGTGFGGDAAFDFVLAV